MLSCKQVAAIASDYLDNNTSLKWQIRMHLLLCANCRRFVRHLKITRQVSVQLENQSSPDDVETIWRNLQEQIKKDTSSNKN